MPTLLKITLQEANEARYSKHAIDGYIREEIAGSKLFQAKIEQGIGIIQEYMDQTYYASKNKRIAQLKDMDIRSIVTEILVEVAYIRKPELFVSATGKVAARLGFSDRREAIITTAEMTAVLADTDAYDIGKMGKQGRLYIDNRMKLSDALIEYIDGVSYLPPMVCGPKKLKTNYDSGYLTISDSLILGHGNHHDGDICLDVLNTMNKVKLRLDTQFLSTVEEKPTFVLDHPDKIANWKAFKIQSHRHYLLMATQGNEFYLNHKPDKRGRIYALGYHLSSEGTPYKKASIELHKEELVTGVPSK